MTAIRTTLAVLLGTLLTSSTPAADKPADQRKGLDFFESKIRPVLVRHCYKCHSAKAASTKMLKGGLQVDTRDGLRKGGETGPAVVPGQPTKSLLVAALKHDGLEMPPKAKLPAAIIADFEKWIRLGAPDPRDGKTVATQSIDIEAGKTHWSFRPLTDAQPPQVADGDTVRNDIDRFIHVLQKAKSITPNPRAAPAMLLRRLHFDLVGLPPSVDEQTKFLARAETDFEAAWVAEVDRLLASQHYGERWGRHWLDLVRFAESNGYAFDKDRANAYQYRDFVIRALNQDMPYDRFVRLQIAGDLIAKTSAKTDPQARTALDAVAATGFLVAGPFTTQQTQKERERSRYEQLDDLVHTLGTSLLGLTVGCARCHSHKYDPLPQSDYYRFVSCFKEVGFGNTNLNLEPEAFQAATAKYSTALKPLSNALSAWEKHQLPGRFADYLTRRPAEPPSPSLGHWHHVGPFPATDFNSAYNTAAGPETAADKRVNLEQVFGDTPIGWQVQPTWTDAKVHNTLTGDNSANYLVRTIESPSALPVEFAFGADDAIKAFLNGKLILNKKTSGAVKADQHKLKVTLDAGRNELLIKIVNASGPSGFSFRLSGGDVPKPVVAAWNVPETKWNPKQRTAIRNWYRTTDPDWITLNDFAATHKKTEPKPKLTPVYAAKVKGTSYQFGGDTFKVYFLARGNADNKQGEATAGFLRVLIQAKADSQHWLNRSDNPAATDQSPVKPRVAAANWLTDVKNGAGHLLARVIVNRIWQYHFGRGLVTTPSDFGTRGDRPTHPELLEWLAGEFIRGGWKLKPIHRLILASHTWMQANGRSADAETIDPNNRLWWRRGAKRLEAELIRDSLLDVSGRLKRIPLYGKGSLDQKSNRRSIYLTVKRGQLTPILQLFDAPDAMQGVGRRNESTVAPQALAMLNSPFIRELANSFAKRVRPDTKTSPKQAVILAYRLALARTPDSSELEGILDFIQRQTDSRKDQSNAQELAIRDFCQLLFCSNEFVYVD